MSRQKGALDVLLGEIGIRVIPTRRRRRAGETHARAACRQIRDSCGEAHLVMTLKCLTETGHRADLWSETILALSDILEQRPDWAERPSELFEALDRIDLDLLRSEALRLRPWPVRHTLRAILFRALDAAMGKSGRSLPTASHRRSGSVRDGTGASSEPA